MTNDNPNDNPNDLRSLALLFTKLGFTSFGGPAVHIAMMRDEVVTKRKWFSEQEYLDLLGITNMIPGPNSTEMALHIGHERAGLKGLIVAGCCFILPAVMITAIIAILYKAYGTLPQVQPFIIGTKPAIIAIIVGAIYPLAKKTYKTKQLILLGCLTFFLALSGYNEIAVMFGIGMLAILSAILFPTLSLSSSSSSSSSTSISSSSQSSPTRQQTTLPLAFTAIRNLAGVSTTGLFLTFLKIGATLYGSGYVLFALLDNELVAKGLLSRQQLVDAIAVGQFTPGPVFSSVTFIGYQLNGYAGAFVSTIGVFLPSFFFVGLLKPLVIRLKTSRLFKVFLDAINAASIAIIALICVSMAHSLGVDYKLIVMLLLFIPLVLLLPKINSCWFILAGSLLGYLLNVCSI